VFPPEDHIGRGALTVIEMANDDMPFIVDSSLALLTDRGYEILLVMHPIVSVRRTAAGKLEAISPEPPRGRRLHPRELRSYPRRRHARR
jgi:NAD-specific glutamate dehydrogenase